MTRWIFSGMGGKSATPIPCRSPNLNLFAHAPPQLSKWPKIKAPTREYVEDALGQRFAAYRRYNDRIDASGESDSESESESMDRSPNKKSSGKSGIVRVNNVPFRMHELFDAICARGIPPPRDGEKRTQYFEEVGGDIGFASCDSNGRPVSDLATAKKLQQIYSSYLEDLIRQWNTVARNSQKNLPKQLPHPSASNTLKPWICQSRELTWLRDALIMYNISRGWPGAAGVQHFFNVLHDLWCAHKAFGESRTAKTKFKSPSFESSSVNSDPRLPDIVEATLAAKLSDPGEPMRVRDAIQHLLFEDLFDVSMIPFLQNILQRDLDATRPCPPTRYNRRHHISLLRLLTRYAGGAQHLRAHLYKDISSEDLTDAALSRSPIIKGGGEATLYQYRVRIGYAVALRVARHSGQAGSDSRPSETVLLAVLHKQLAHDNILEFLGVAERMGVIVCIVTKWHTDDAITYLNNPANHSDLPKLMQDISKGLSYLHDSGVVHGDLHGKNVLVANPVKAVIADFGHSVCDGEEKESEKPRISAMQGHCAPELRGPQPEWPSRASDVFACASTFVELLFGRSPDAQSYCQPLHSTGYRAIPDGQWPALDSLIQDMWREVPVERPSVQDVQEKIQKINKSIIRSKKAGMRI